MENSGNSTSSHQPASGDAGIVSSGAPGPRDQAHVGSTREATNNREQRRHAASNSARTQPNLRRPKGTLSQDQHRQLVERLLQQRIDRARAEQAAQASKQAAMLAEPSPPPASSAWFTGLAHAAEHHGYLLEAQDAVRTLAQAPSGGLRVWVVIEHYEDAERHRRFAAWLKQHETLYPASSVQVHEFLTHEPELADLGYPAAATAVQVQPERQRKLERSAAKALEQGFGTAGSREVLEWGDTASWAMNLFLNNTVVSSFSESMPQALAYLDAFWEAMGSFNHTIEAVLPSTQGLHFMVIPARYWSRNDVDWNREIVIRIDPLKIVDQGRD